MVSAPRRPHRPPRRAIGCGMDIVLIAGLRLDGSSWDRVVPGLTAAGHRPHPLTLPGLEAGGTNRAGITLRDHVDAVVAAASG